VLVEQDIAVLGMKPMGDPFVLVSGTVTAVECLHYAMNLPTSVVITGCDSLPCSSRHCTRHGAFAAERGSRGSAARPDGARRARREVRAVQDDPSLRWDIPESTMAGVRRCAWASLDWERWAAAWRARLLAARHDVVVYNRTPERTGPWSNAAPRWGDGANSSRPASTSCSRAWRTTQRWSR